jgi:flagellar protein FlaG
MEGVGVIRSQEATASEAAVGLTRTTPNQGPQADPKLQAKHHQTLSQKPADGPDASQEKIEQIAQAMENYVSSIQRDLKIQVHKDTGSMMVKIISAEDGKTIREIPPEELLNLAAKMDEMLGALFNSEA